MRVTPGANRGDLSAPRRRRGEKVYSSGGDVAPAPGLENNKHSKGNRPRTFSSVAAPAPGGDPEDPRPPPIPWPRGRTQAAARRPTPALASPSRPSAPRTPRPLANPSPPRGSALSGASQSWKRPARGRLRRTPALSPVHRSPRRTGPRPPARLACAPDNRIVGTDCGLLIHRPLRGVCGSYKFWR